MEGFRRKNESKGVSAKNAAINNRENPVKGIRVLIASFSKELLSLLIAGLIISIAGIVVALITVISSATTAAMRNQERVGRSGRASVVPAIRASQSFPSNSGENRSDFALSAID